MHLKHASQTKKGCCSQHPFTDDPRYEPEVILRIHCAATVADTPWIQGQRVLLFCPSCPLKSKVSHQRKEFRQAAATLQMQSRSAAILPARLPVHQGPQSPEQLGAHPIWGEAARRHRLEPLQRRRQYGFQDLPKKSTHHRSSPNLSTDRQ